MTRSTLALAFVLTAIGVAAAWDADRAQPRPNDVAAFMDLKLDHAQDLLEALSTEDFPGIAKHSQELSLLSQQATWQVLQTPEYNQHSAEFRRAADAILLAAREKNLDAAALAYVDMTMKCFNCHKYVRGTKLAKAD